MPQNIATIFDFFIKLFQKFDKRLSIVNGGSLGYNVYDLHLYHNGFNHGVQYY